MVDNCLISLANGGTSSCNINISGTNAAGPQLQMQLSQLLKPTAVLLPLTSVKLLLKNL